MRRRVAAVGLGRDHRLDLGVGQFLADRIGIVAFVGEQRIDAVRDDAHEWAEALDVVRLSGRQDEGEWASLRVASGVELGGEAAARAAERLGVPSSFFIPAAQ